MDQQELYHLKSISDTLDKHEKEALIFYTEIRGSLVQIQTELRELQKQRTQDQKDIEYLKTNYQKHESRINAIFVTLVFIGFIFIGIMSK